MKFIDRTEKKNGAMEEYCIMRRYTCENNATQFYPNTRYVCLISGVHVIACVLLNLRAFNTGHRRECFTFVLAVLIVPIVLDPLVCYIFIR